MYIYVILYTYTRRINRVSWKHRVQYYYYYYSCSYAHVVRVSLRAVNRKKGKPKDFFLCVYKIKSLNDNDTGVHAYIITVLNSNKFSGQYNVLQVRDDNVAAVYCAVHVYGDLRLVISLLLRCR